MKKATSKKTSSPEVSFYKSFNIIGDNVEGIFGGFYSSTYGLNVQIGDYFISLNPAVIKSKFHLIKNDLKKGKTKLKIVYTAEENKKGRKQPLKKFDVFMDDILVQNKPKEAVNSEIEDFFTEETKKKK